METIQLVNFILIGTVSILLEHFPSLASDWHGLSSKHKAILFAVMTITVVSGVNALACFTNISAMPCVDWRGLVEQLVYTYAGVFAFHNGISKYVEL